VQSELIILCGRYQGFDERINLLAHEKLKVGSAILSGGEIAAAYILDAVIRLLPDVLHNQESKSIETFDQKNYPLFTKPIHPFNPNLHPDLSVSDTLLSGNHSEINKERYGIDP
jgi:tRNA (guanine37-N1)-methyltransferase